MQVRVLAFATARDALGAGERTVELPEGGTVAELRSALVRDHPDVEALWPRLAVAVDGALASSETPLRDGAEVALLPPVSGGSPRAWLTDEPVEPIAVADRVSAGGRGAVVLFLGTARDGSGDRVVEGLEYSAYRPMAEARLERIAVELEAATPGLAVAIAHRLGRLGVGEISVVIATASPHREEAYRANRQALERLKREVPIWKRERYAGGEVAWREEERLVEG